MPWLEVGYSGVFRRLVWISREPRIQMAMPPFTHNFPSHISDGTVVRNVASLLTRTSVEICLRAICMRDTREPNAGYSESDREPRSYRRGAASLFSIWGSLTRHFECHNFKCHNHESGLYGICGGQFGISNVTIGNGIVVKMDFRFDVELHGSLLSIWHVGLGPGLALLKTTSQTGDAHHWTRSLLEMWKCENGLQD